MFEKIKAFFRRKRKKKEEPAEILKPQETAVPFDVTAAPESEEQTGEESQLSCAPQTETPADEAAVPFDAPASPEACPEEAQPMPEEEAEEDVPSGRYTPEYMEFLEKLDREAEEAEKKPPVPTETDETKGIDAPAVRK